MTRKINESPFLIYIYLVWCYFIIVTACVAAVVATFKYFLGYEDASWAELVVFFLGGIYCFIVLREYKSYGRNLQHYIFGYFLMACVYAAVINSDGIVVSVLLPFIWYYLYENKRMIELVKASKKNKSEA